MDAIYRLLRATIPDSIRHSGLLQRAAHAIFAQDQFYHHGYYNDVERDAVKSASVMARSIVECFRPKTVIDVGCGTGALLKAFRDLNCEVLGLEYSQAGIDYCQKRGIPIGKFNIERDEVPNATHSDVVLSFEVAEHLPSRFANRYVNLLCRLAPVVVISAATPGEGGHGHINEQPHLYWIEKFTQNGYRFDSGTSQRLAVEWQAAGAANWYSDNVLVFTETTPA